MFLDVLRIVLPLLGGGVAGAFISDWLRRKQGRVQTIPLIERVNRLVKSELTGITLARVIEGENGNRLEEISRVREYQLTLRNTSSIHLQKIEIQFEFPSLDVEAWPERPALSKTSPIELTAAVTPPWKKGFRWQIPEFPSTDSIEFTFRAIDPDSDDYEVALYNGGQVIVAKTKLEPSSTAKSIGLGSVFFGWHNNDACMHLIARFDFCF